MRLLHPALQLLQGIGPFTRVSFDQLEHAGLPQRFYLLSVTRNAG
jgi:hypothetical protein